MRRRLPTQKAVFNMLIDKLAGSGGDPEQIADLIMATYRLPRSWLNAVAREHLTMMITVTRASNEVEAHRDAARAAGRDPDDDDSFDMFAVMSDIRDGHTDPATLDRLDATFARYRAGIGKP